MCLAKIQSAGEAEWGTDVLTVKSRLESQLV